MFLIEHSAEGPAASRQRGLRHVLSWTVRTAPGFTCFPHVTRKTLVLHPTCMSKVSAAPDGADHSAAGRVHRRPGEHRRHGEDNHHAEISALHACPPAIRAPDTCADVRRRRGPDRLSGRTARPDQPVRGRRHGFRGRHLGQRRQLRRLRRQGRRAAPPGPVSAGRDPAHGRPGHVRRRAGRAEPDTGQAAHRGQPAVLGDHSVVDGVPAGQGRRQRRGFRPLRPHPGLPDLRPAPAGRLHVEGRLRVAARHQR